MELYCPGADGATPIDPDWLDDLIPPGISTMEELDALESEGITAATIWAMSQRRYGSSKTLLTERSVLELHGQMFGAVWRWAGSYRQHDMNLGSPWYSVQREVIDLVANFRLRSESRTETADEIAIQFHHLLVKIHPFVNGNGRHARLMADLLVMALGENAFTWGASDPHAQGVDRTAYIAAIKHADREFEYGPLLEFARS